MDKTSIGKGVGLAACASISWGTMGVCSQYLLQKCAFSPMDLVTLRLLIAGTIFLFIEQFVFKRNIFAPLKDVSTAIGILMVGFLIFLSQVTFMYSVGNSNAGTTAVILTIVPLLCASWLSIAEKRPLRLKEGVCFLVASSGVLFIVTKGNFGTLDVSCVGVLWGLASALCSAAYSIQPRKLILNVGVGPVIGLGMLFASLVSSIINPPWTMDAEWHILSFLSFGFIVIFGTVAAFWCYLSSLKYVSAVVVGLLVCIEPLTAYLLSALAFGTRIGVWEGLGICLVLLNVLILSIPDRKQLRCQA